MPIAKCPRCKNLFTKEAYAVCPDCQEAEEQDCEKVRETLEKHPDLNAAEVAERSEVDLDVVTRMLDSGMLAAEGLGGSSAVCGQCGAPAISIAKKLCKPCLEKLNMDIAIARRDITESSKPSNQEKPPPSVQEVLNMKRKKL